MQYQLKLNRSQDELRELTLKKMEIIPFAINECPELCSCAVCLKQQLEEHKLDKKYTQKIFKQPKQRKLTISSIQKDDFLTVCLMLQRAEEVVRPLNINIIDTVFLKDREYAIYVYYDNGLKFIKNKAFFHTEMEKQFIERKVELEIEFQLKQIRAGVHPSIKLTEYQQNNLQITNKLKQAISELVANQSILVARYQSSETTLLGKFELHQLVVLSKTNPIFNNLLHLQLYLYNEKDAFDCIEKNKRNSKDYYIHRYTYLKDNRMFGDIVCEQSYLTDPSLRGQRQWDKEKLFSEKLELKEYFKYTCHKIAVYIQSFHKLSIIEMEVHFVVNYPQKISIINILNLKTAPSEETQWVIKTGRTLSTAEKIQINDVNLNEKNKPQTQRSMEISQQITPFTQKVVEKIKPITVQVVENNKQNTRTQEAFKILNPGINESISELLDKQQYHKMMNNFPKQLKRYQSMDKEPLTQRTKEEPLTTSREVLLSDYLLKSRAKKKKQQTVDSPFLRSISRRFFSRRNSADFH